MVISHYAKAQREGDTWMIGYTQTANHPEFSVILLDFTTGNLNLKWDGKEVFKFSETGSNICDAEGKPLLWTNGMQVRGAGNINVIDTIAYEAEFYNYWSDHYWEDLMISEGFSFLNGAVILPMSFTGRKYYVLYHLANRNNPFYEVDGWASSLIEFSEKKGFNALYKDKIFMKRQRWYSNTINAIRHANGRDWFLITFDKDSAYYYSVLLDVNGVEFYNKGDSKMDFTSSNISQVVFSPVGNFLARTFLTNDEANQIICLYSVDRCSGELKMLDTILLSDESSMQGVAFSPSEHYLYYTTANFELWRLDLQAPDIQTSAKLVGEYDGFLEPEGHEPTSFGPMMQTPDGRIYIVPVAGSSQYLHVIDRPDEENPADIRLLQHHVSLVVRNGRTAPNIPNFRLGPLDGSPCDTLGIDNLAKSRWRWEPNIVTQPLSIRFTDLSFYEPTAWHWDFGDGQTSELVHPIHTFPDYGMYYVCQTVSNQYASDSTCQWVEIAPYTSDEEPQDGHTYFVSPNPFNHELSIQSTLDRFTEARISVFDIHGRSVMPSTQLPIPISINFADIPSGMYILKLDIGDQGMQVFKVVKN
jgi:hypothetical protein